MPLAPAPKYVPAAWDYAKVRPFLMESGSLITAKEAVRRVLILENATYSVITPEGCAAILWKDRAASAKAAAALKITAKDLRELGIADEVVPE